MSSSRQIVSYDDISLPYEEPQPRQPPSKKHKRNNNNNNRQNNNRGRQQQQPRNHNHSNNNNSNNNRGSKQEVDSRELTHDEMWDDSALIDAWDAATEEYEAYHGPDKDWKKERKHKSALWYNLPTSVNPESHPSSAPSDTNEDEQYEEQQYDENEQQPEEDGDSRPIDFNTFVPTHDPSLDVPSHVPPQPPANIPGPDYAAYYLPQVTGTVVDQDEAFQRALGAMYWGGYWTAMYHAQRATANASGNKRTIKVEDNEGERDEMALDEEEDEGEVQDLVSTQR